MQGQKFDWAKRLGLSHPVVQAGMGGGCSGAKLATAVSLAGGLGTVGTMPEAAFRTALAETRRHCEGRPFAVNLLMPFIRPAHIDACLAERPAVAVRFYGFGADVVTRLQQAGIAVWQQVGDVEQARRALADGVDALIAQGSEAGGHLATGTMRREPLLRALREQVSPSSSVPILAAGGIYDADSAQQAIEQSADGVVAGTRFLLTPEADIHTVYKNRLLATHHTLATSLFSFGWVAPHRVAANAATKRWLNDNGDTPAWVLGLNRLLEPSRRVLPMSLATRLVRMQRLQRPFYTPFPLTPEMPRTAIELTPIYAGECICKINELSSTSDVVAELAQGCAAAETGPAQATQA